VRNAGKSTSRIGSRLRSVAGAYCRASCGVICIFIFNPVKISPRTSLRENHQVLTGAIALCVRRLSPSPPSVVAERAYAARMLAQYGINAPSTPTFNESGSNNWGGVDTDKEDSTSWWERVKYYAQLAFAPFSQTSLASYCSRFASWV
jgi:hypothetical protein